MRISDWSSDVCSSDLLHHRQGREWRLRPRHRVFYRAHPGHDGGDHAGPARGRRAAPGAPGPERAQACGRDGGSCAMTIRSKAARVVFEQVSKSFGPVVAVNGVSFAIEAGQLVTLRSEEHTSELQSLMRISYAVF